MSIENRPKIGAEITTDMGFDESPEEIEELVAETTAKMQEWERENNRATIDLSESGSANFRKREEKIRNSEIARQKRLIEENERLLAESGWADSEDKPFSVLDDEALAKTEIIRNPVLSKPKNDETFVSSGETVSFNTLNKIAPRPKKDFFSRILRRFGINRKKFDLKKLQDNPHANPKDWEGEDPSTPPTGVSFEELKQKVTAVPTPQSKPTSSLFSRWGKRLMLLGLFSQWGGDSVQPHHTESPNDGVRTELQGGDYSDTGLNQETQTDWQEVIKIGTVGADANHNAIVKILQNQIIPRALETFNGDTARASKWALEKAISMAQTEGLLDKGLKTEAIGRLVINAEPDGTIGFFDLRSHKKINNPKIFLYDIK